MYNIDVLSVPASTTLVEWVFSHASYILSKKRHNQPMKNQRWNSYANLTLLCELCYTSHPYSASVTIQPVCRFTQCPNSAIPFSARIAIQPVPFQPGSHCSEFHLSRFLIDCLQFFEFIITGRGMGQCKILFFFITLTTSRIKIRPSHVLATVPKHHPQCAGDVCNVAASVRWRKKIKRKIKLIVSILVSRSYTYFLPAEVA